METAVLGAALVAAGIVCDDVRFVGAGLLVIIGGAANWAVALIRQIDDLTAEKQRLEAELKEQGVKLARALDERDSALRALAEAGQATEPPRS